ncbi:MAG: hypothetical protein M0R70_05130 [Nitrospirae bacterium]|nr:hypothetical protein [Nitrospirota bacterium]
MKRALIAAVALSLVLAVSAFAADGGQPQNAPPPNFDQRKSDILKMLDGRMTSLQEAKNCIQAATNHDDIRTCREKHRAEMMEMRGDMKQQRGMGGPGGPMGR